MQLVGEPIDAEKTTQTATWIGVVTLIFGCSLAWSLWTVSGPVLALDAGSPLRSLIFNSDSDLGSQFRTAVIVSGTAMFVGLCAILRITFLIERRTRGAGSRHYRPAAFAFVVSIALVLPQLAAIGPDFILSWEIYRALEDDRLGSYQQPFGVSPVVTSVAVTVAMAVALALMLRRAERP